ncbi:uncharacterized protein LOC128988079 [Macrosteles quadrilineatus]|uniref:uncharacterized protein LOC128988079 n=1 Tax=Macrosteles quadrilineatus TaxID=74068 RepID=UPI0023E22AB0|nr:uncharacterized protein LOC128988079 [Macrosteles quadrilineatus]
MWSYIPLALLACVLVSAETQSEREEKAMDPGAARSMLADIAKELIARSGTSSQVLSLNLTNMIILLVLKGLLLGAAMWGTGAWKGRSVDEVVSPPSISLLTESELVLLISYLMGEGDNKYDCFLRVACQEPKKAREYLAAGTMLIKGAKAMGKIIPINPKYERLLQELHRAVQYSSSGGVCDQRYSCGQNNV